MWGLDLRILGKGKTAKAIKEIYPDALLYDDNDKNNYDFQSKEKTIISPGIPPYNYLVKNSLFIVEMYIHLSTGKHASSIYSEFILIVEA